MIALASVLGAAWLAWTWWTVRRLWRTGATPYERMVYRFGVRGWGLWMFAMMSLSFLARDFDPERSLGRSVLQVFLVVGTCAPIMLWGGYWWGRAMALFFRLQPPSAPPPDLDS